LHDNAPRPVSPTSVHAGRSADPGGAAEDDTVTASEKYTAAAYLVVFVAVLAYLVIMSAKVSRLERELAELTELARRRRERAEEREVAHVG
jgi:CcmD family protein